MLAVLALTSAAVSGFHLGALTPVRPAVAVSAASRLGVPLLKERLEEKTDVGANVVKEMMAGEKSENLLQKVKDAGVAGAISYAAWELGFWGVSVPVACFGFYELTGHWPDFSNQDDMAKLGAEAFAFVNVARFAVPIRIGLALSTTPWVQANVVDKFLSKKEPLK